MLGLVGKGGPLECLAPPSPAQAQVTHQALDRAAGDRIPFPLHLGPHLVGSIDIEVVGVDPSNLGLERLVSDPPGTRCPPLGGVVGPGSELQRGADRLDSPSTPFASRCSGLLLRSTVELGREEHRGVLQDFVGTPELTVLLLEGLQFLALVGGQPRSATFINLGPTDPGP
jgi:hypothetical protein